MFGKYGSYTDRLAAENRELKQKIATYESETAIAEMKASCDKRIRGAEGREKRSHDGWMKALEANKELKERNAALWREKESYRCRNNTLQIKNERLERFEGNRLERIEKLEEEKDSLRAERDKLQAEGIEKDKQIIALKEEICRMQAIIDHDGTTNGIPTSQTPPGKKKVIPNTREKTGRRRGGQPGHTKKTLVAFRDEEVTKTEEHMPETCPECGGELEKLEEAVVKDEADYEVRIIRKRHRFPQCRCKECGTITRAKIPERLKEKNQYGPGIQSIALALVDIGFVSVNRAQEIIAGLLNNGLTPSVGFIGKIQKKAARLLSEFCEEVKKTCLTQRVLYWDDTVIFMNTARACFRFYGNEKVAYYRAHTSKDAKGIEEDGILSALTEKTYLMHDHVKYNYRKEFLFRNIECIQHMERELEKVFRASNHPWAQEMKTLIQEMLHKRKKYLKEKIESFTSEETNQFEERLENLLIKAHREYESETNRYFSADEMNAIRKLEEYRQNYFAWVYDFTLPTTNNISESGLRMTKTKQKVSGQFLKEETAAEFAAVRTYTETCRKNGVNEYEALKRLMQENPYTVKEILTGMT
jgi:rRNA maturation protein Nop10